MPPLQLGRNHHLVSHGGERLAHKLFIHERTVDFCGIEESDAVFDRCANERNHFLPSPCHFAVTRTQPHAAQSQGRHFKIAPSWLAFLHCFPPFVRAIAYSSGTSKAPSRVLRPVLSVESGMNSTMRYGLITTDIRRDADGWRNIPISLVERPGLH